MCISRRQGLQSKRSGDGQERSDVPRRGAEGIKYAWTGPDRRRFSEGDYHNFLSSPGSLGTALESSAHLIAQANS